MVLLTNASLLDENNKAIKVSIGGESKWAWIPKAAITDESLIALKKQQVIDLPVAEWFILARLTEYAGLYNQVASLQEAIAELQQWKLQAETATRLAKSILDKIEG